MKLTKNKSTGIYSVNFRTEHGRRTMSTGCTNEVDAKDVVDRAKVKELELAARAGRLTHHVVTQIVAGKKVTLQQAFAQWSQWLESCGKAPRTILCTTSNVAAWMRDMKLESVAPGAVTEKHINAWINDKGSTSKATSRRVALSNIRNFWQFCIAKGYTIANPAALVCVRMDILSHEQKELKKHTPFTDADVASLLKETEGADSSFWHAAIALARWTGLRLGDIAQLEWDCFDKPGTIAVWTDKRDKRVELPLTTELASAVARIPINSGKHCFPDVYKTYLDPKKHGVLSTEFKRICQKLNMPEHSFHDLRRAFASEAWKQGRKIEHIKIDLGHSSESTTKRYIHE